MHCCGGAGGNHMDLAVGTFESIIMSRFRIVALAQTEQYPSYDLIKEKSWC
jgi:hypothetical protein